MVGGIVVARSGSGRSGSGGPGFLSVISQTFISLANRRMVSSRNADLSRPRASSWAEAAGPITTASIARNDRLVAV